MTDIEADLMIANAEIKRLQAQLAELREDCDITDTANTALHGALQEAERREKAAVEDLEYACGSSGEFELRSICDICRRKQTDGTCPTQCEINSLAASNKRQWRGPQDEDAEEQGRLVRVPCKIGDTVWAIRSYHGILHPQQGVVSEMYFRLDMTLQIVVKHVTRGELGRTIFLTREEAEEALLKGESHE